jgi:DNA-binding transcriptional MerR regulator
VTTWTIGEAAEKCGLSQHTLRWYERIGLLPAIERGSDGRRPGTATATWTGWRR